MADTDKRGTAGPTTGGDPCAARDFAARHGISLAEAEMLLKNLGSDPEKLAAAAANLRRG